MLDMVLVLALCLTDPKRARSANRVVPGVPLARFR
jgi:hypothetical protein